MRNLETFEGAVLGAYLPAYKSLYAITSDMGKVQALNIVLSIVQVLKRENVCAYGVGVSEQCENVLKLATIDTGKVRRRDIDKALFDLLYSLRTELKAFCVEYYPLEGARTLKLNRHYTWDI